MDSEGDTKHKIIEETPYIHVSIRESERDSFTHESQDEDALLALREKELMNAVIQAHLRKSYSSEQIMSPKNDCPDEIFKPSPKRSRSEKSSENEPRIITY